MLKNEPLLIVWGLAPSLFLLLIASKSSRSPDGLRAVLAWLGSGKLLKAGPLPLKPLVLLPGRKGPSLTGERLKPMFCGDWAANPMFWVSVGLLKDGDGVLKASALAGASDQGSTVGGETTVAGDGAGARHGSTAAAANPILFTFWKCFCPTQVKLFFSISTWRWQTIKHLPDDPYNEEKTNMQKKAYIFYK